VHALAAGGVGKKSPISHYPAAEPVVLSAKLDASNLPEPPADMPDEGVELWEQTLPWLVQVNVIQTIDLPVFAQMCRLYAQVCAAQKVIDEQGMFALGSGGQIVEHPAMKGLQVAQMMFLRHAGEFGMTTMARTRLGLMDVQRRSIQQDMDWTLGPSTRDVEGVG
jgi:P27 family predicted phage terminase small subunit